MKSQILRIDVFEVLATKIKLYTTRFSIFLKDYFKRLLFPIYLFPIKLATYSLYYLVVFVFKLVIALLSLAFESIIYPFKSLKNFLKAIVVAGVVLYMVVSLFVIGDYLTKQYGWWGKFLCSVGTRDKLQDSVVRIVGGYSEGSGFFIADNQILTNFHVIADEPSPKIILPDGRFLTPARILGNVDADLAVLFIDGKYPDLVFPLPY